MKTFFNIKKTILEVILIALSYYLLLNITLFLLFNYLNFEFISSNINVEIINTTVISLLGLIIFFSFRKRFSAMQIKKTPTIKSITIIILLILLCRIITDPIYRLDLIFGKGNTPVFFDYGKLETSILILFFLKTIIITPIVEELTFRKLILNKLFDHKLPVFTSLIISSLLFSLIHINPLTLHTNTLFITFITGMLFGFIYYKYGFLYSIITHSGYNLLWLIVMINGEKYFYFLNKLNFGTVYWSIVILALVLILFIIKQITLIVLKK